MRKVIVGLMALGIIAGVYADMDTALQSIGSLGMGTLYFGYVAIGALADGFEYNAYEADYLRDVCDEMIGVFESNKGYMEMMLNDDTVEGSDADYARGFIKAYDLLINEAKYLKYYANSGDQDDVDKFHEYRNKAWEKIKELGGIEE